MAFQQLNLHSKFGRTEYGISRDKTIVDFYRELNLDYHLGLNNFLQPIERRDAKHGLMNTILINDNHNINHL